MKTSGIDYPEPIFAGENKMRTRLAGFVFVLVFIMAMTYSGFMVWAQETTGQTAAAAAQHPHQQAAVVVAAVAAAQHRPLPPQ